MTTHVALLRGINVGGHNKIAMADLRDVVSSLGHTGVATYVQSGNVVFTSPRGETTVLAAELEQAIAETLGVPSAVIVLSRAELAQAIAANPYAAETNPKYVHVVFTRGDLGPAEVASIAAAERRARDKGSPDEAQVVGSALFLHTPGGMGRSELAAQLARSSAFKAGTARNWATVTHLLALLDA